MQYQGEPKKIAQATELSHHLSNTVAICKVTSRKAKEKQDYLTNLRQSSIISS